MACATSSLSVHQLRPAAAGGCAARRTRVSSARCAVVVRAQKQSDVVSQALLGVAAAALVALPGAPLRRAAV